MSSSDVNRNKDSVRRANSGDHNYSKRKHQKSFCTHCLKNGAQKYIFGMHNLEIFSWPEGEGQKVRERQKITDQQGNEHSHEDK